MDRAQAGEHLILGAGSAGLSLALALLREGVREPITLVDARTAFGRDRTWCLFDVRPTPFARLARQRWAAWELGGARSGSARHPYLRLDSADVYAAALARLDRAPNVELLLGERVLEVGDGWASTERGRLEAAWVYDGLALGSPALRGVRPELWQRFLGHEVEVDAPVFEPGVATLMDFGVPQPDGGLAFMYVLPFDARRALVEHTTIGRGTVSSAIRREAIAEYLAGRGARDWRVTHTERGAIPMTTADLAPGRGERTVAIGVAGGAVRPSSGYAFGRIQAQVGAIAAAVAAGQAPPRRLGPPRRLALDAIFLRALAAHPEGFPEYFRRIAERVPGDAFARFMGDASSPVDEARVIAALPKAPFAAAAAEIAAGRRSALPAAARRARMSRPRPVPSSPPTPAGSAPPARTPATAGPPPPSRTGSPRPPRTPASAGPPPPPRTPAPA
jgi:lycopene beta-cyclase